MWGFEDYSDNSYNRSRTEIVQEQMEDDIDEI